jgi:hypothetical protein
MQHGTNTLVVASIFLFSIVRQKLHEKRFHGRAIWGCFPWFGLGRLVPVKINLNAINQSNVFIKPFLHQLMSQSSVQKPSLKPQTASNAGVEARWLGKTP